MKVYIVEVLEDEGTSLIGICHDSTLANEWKTKYEKSIEVLKNTPCPISQEKVEAYYNTAYPNKLISDEECDLYLNWKWDTGRAEYFCGCVIIEEEFGKYLPDMDKGSMNENN